jgi:hypothetical protein
MSAPTGPNPATSVAGAVPARGTEADRDLFAAELREAFRPLR